MFVPLLHIVGEGLCMDIRFPESGMRFTTRYRHPSCIAFPKANISVIPIMQNGKMKIQLNRPSTVARKKISSKPGRQL